MDDNFLIKFKNISLMEGNSLNLLYKIHYSSLFIGMPNNKYYEYVR